MLHFMTGLFKTMFSDEEIHILIIGHEGAGKTTLLEQLKHMYTRETTSNTVNIVGNTNAVSTESIAEGDNNISTNSINTLPHPALSSTLLSKRIKPTIGVNLVRLTHYFTHKEAHNATTQDRKVLHNENMRAKEKTKCMTNANSKNANAGDIDHTHETESNKSVKCNMENKHEVNCTQEIIAVTSIANPYAGRSEKTHLLLWDVGGAQALRSLWAPYFPQCHGVIYVIDSTLPFTLLNANRCNGSDSSCKERDGVIITSTLETCEGADINNSCCESKANEESVECRKYTSEHLREIYRGNRATLQRLLLHPELECVPFLVLSNKADCTEHVSLTELQDALGVVDWALFDTFYNVHKTQELETSEDNEESTSEEEEEEEEEWEEEEEEENGKLKSNSNAKQLNGHKPNGKAMKRASCSHSSTSLSSSTLLSEAKRHDDEPRHSLSKNEYDVNDNRPDACTRSKCGFGKITWKLAEISALSGFGVNAAMDWLVAQLIQHHRQINEGGDGKSSKHV